MNRMDKNKLLFFPFFLGIILMVYSWYLSYPLSIDSLGDFVFNHVSIAYWISLPLTLVPMYLISLNTKSNTLRWLITVIAVLTMYSLSYFYPMVPGSDSHYFRGMNEYFSKTGDLTPFGPKHLYFQWPLFFLLIDMSTSLIGISLVSFEFVLYTIIGFLLATAMYIYVSKAYSQSGFLAVVSSFIVMFYFLNFQCVPFSFAFSFLFLLFMLEAQCITSLERTFATIILFTAITLTHSFVGMFFVLYEFICYVLNRKRMRFRLFVLTLMIYLAVLFFQAELSFAQIINTILSASPDYGMKIATTIKPSSVPLDVIAQLFSRFVVIGTTLLCLAGFIFLYLKRGIRLLDKAVFLSGALYLGVGSLVLLLGLRALPLVIVPVSLGAAYIIESRIRPYLKYLFLVLLLLFVFIPIHSSFNDSQIFFQTEEAYRTENFMIDHYNWTNSGRILAHIRVINYLQAKQPSAAHYESDFSVLFPRIKDYDSIVYTVGLGKNLLRYNYTTERILREEKLNVLYNNGFSYIATKSSNFTWAPTR